MLYMMVSIGNEYPNAGKEGYSNSMKFLDGSELFDARMVDGVSFLRQSLNVLQHWSKLHGKTGSSARGKDLCYASNTHDQFALSIDIIYDRSVFVMSKR
jgi:hypothetical protein